MLMVGQGTGGHCWYCKQNECFLDGCAFKRDVRFENSVQDFNPSTCEAEAIVVYTASSRKT